MRNLTVFLFLVLLVPYVNAEGNGEITQLDYNTLRMSYDTEVRALNHTITANFDGIPFNFYETDTRFTTEFSVHNNNFFELYLEDSPNGEREYPLLYCTANEIPDYDRYTYQSNTYCPDHWFKYKLRDVREGRRYNIKIPPLINGTNAFWWSIGGDSQGNNAGKGGGGLPVCAGLQVNMIQNQSVTPYQGQFKLSGIITYIGYSAGCTGNLIRYDINRTDTGALTLLPSASQGSTALNCSGQSCIISPPSIGVWYHRYPTCDKSAGYSVWIRGTFKGYYNSRLYTYYRNLYHTCEAEVIPPVEENATLPKNTFFLLDGEDYKRSSYVYRTLFLTAGFLGLVLILYRRGEENGEK